MHRFEDLSPDDPYYPVWQQHHSDERRGKVFMGFAAVAAPFFYIWGNSLWPESSLRFSGLVLYLLIVAAWCVYVVKKRERPHCPRCGEVFMRSDLEVANGEGYSAGGAMCDHCGLPKWAPYEAGQPETTDS